VRKAERLSVILDRVVESGSVEVVDLAASLGVSGATVRRDLQTLSASRLVLRTHGGAMAADLGDEPLPVRIKASRRQGEKIRIGRAAAGLVGDGDVVGMTGGTTTLELARALADRRGITVVTNAINIAAELAGHPGLHLVVIGGVARQSYELVGPAAEAMLTNYHLDIAFIGVDGLTPEEGCTTHDEMEAQTDRAFIARAKRSVVITDSSKIGTVRFARIAPLSQVRDVVTDDGATPDQLDALRRAGIQVATV
jgi:DeoR family transcriptional regulator, aga operon transcriptional repressor